MKLSSDILLKELSKYVTLEACGNMRTTLTLEAPVFSYAGTPYENDRVYIGRIGELSPPPEKISCQIICVGGRLPAAWNPGNSCAFSVTSETDLLYIFNIVQNTFLRYGRWNSDLYRILNTTADLEEMIRITSELLGKSITLVNNQLEIVAQSLQGNDRQVQNSWKYMLPPNARLWADTHKRNTAFREPFFFLLEGLPSYCINIYIRDSYWGMIALSVENEEPSSYLTVLFCHFFEIFRLALAKNLNRGHGTMLTLRSVFADLLNCLPVSPSRLEKACRNSSQEKSLWICAALRPEESMKQLPPEYFCKQLEQTLRRCWTVHSGGYIALFYPLPPAAIDIKGICPGLEEGLKESDLFAGISQPYDDILKSHDFFRQAVIALEMADTMETSGKFFYFQDCALPYALKNSIGELTPSLMMPQGLRQLLKESEEGADHWETLRVYLDNEMNASRTARDLFIHRTTLQNRLNKIREFVDLDTPESRMYLRYCIWLHKLFETL